MRPFSTHKRCKATKCALESPADYLPLKMSLENEYLDLPFIEDKNN